MASQLNIQDAEIIERARRLARQRSVSVTEVIRQALRDEDERAIDERERRLASLMALIDEVADSLAQSGKTFDNGDWLYDPKTGLPA